MIILSIFESGKVKYHQLDFSDVEQIYDDNDFFLNNTGQNLQSNTESEKNEKVITLKQYHNLRSMQDGTPEAKHLRNLMLINYANLDHSMGKVSEFLMQLKNSNIDQESARSITRLPGYHGDRSVTRKYLIIW